MEGDIQIAKDFGATGVVFGCLTETKEIDVESNSRLLEKAKSLELISTFHRAFDFLFDMGSGINQLLDMRFDRVLTSGGQQKAYTGLNQIMQLIFSKHILVNVFKHVDQLVVFLIHYCKKGILSWGQLYFVYKADPFF